MSSLSAPRNSRKSRHHSKAYKASVVTTCQQPGASVSRVALDHGLNAILVRRWIKLAENRARKKPSFVPVPLTANHPIPAGADALPGRCRAHRQRLGGKPDPTLGAGTFQLVVCRITARGQRAAAIMMSLIQSAKLNGHDPYVYLKDVLTRLLTHKNSLSKSCCLTTGNL
jgi:transposase